MSTFETMFRGVKGTTAELNLIIETHQGRIAQAKAEHIDDHDGFIKWVEQEKRDIEKAWDVCIANEKEQYDDLMKAVLDRLRIGDVRPGGLHDAVVHIVGNAFGNLMMWLYALARLWWILDKISPHRNPDEDAEKEQEPLTMVPDEIYDQWVKEKDQMKKPQNYKTSLTDKWGVRSKVRWSEVDQCFLDKSESAGRGLRSEGGWIQIMSRSQMDEFIESKMDELTDHMVATIYSSVGLSTYVAKQLIGFGANEQIVLKCCEVIYKKVQDANFTGGHYRQHYTKGKDIYGHH